MTEAQARHELVSAGRRLVAEGLVSRSWGNLSVRLDTGRMAVTPSGILWNDVTEDMISVVDLETGDWVGRWKPSGERKVHREIYRRRPEVHAVVHTHQNAASVCATARVSVQVGPDLVPCAAYALPGTKTLTRATVDALGAGPAVLMANHGVFAVGANLDQAFDRVRGLERACADTIAARAPSALPARVDAPWQDAWVTAVTLADGTRASLSAAPFTRAWARSKGRLAAVLDDLAQLAGAWVPVVAQLPPSLPRSGVVLVRGQGALVGGPDAEALALVVEKAARAVLGAEGLGGAHKFPAWEAALMRLVYRQSYSKQAAAKA